MQCQNCGLNNTPGARFCKKCGNPLPAAPAAQPPPYPQSSPPPAMPNTAPPSYAQNPPPPNMPAYPPPPPPAPQVQQANWGAPYVANAPSAQPIAPVGSIRRIQKISALSVLKVVAAIYGLMYAVFGFLFLVLPGILGAGLLDSFGLGRSFGGASIIVLLLVYVISIAIGGLSAGVFAAIGALIYNLVVRYIGGIEVEVA